MDLTRLRLLALGGLTWAGGAGAADPAPRWILPPLDGEIAGELTPVFLPGAPPVKWRATIHTAKPRERTVTVAMDGPGWKLRGSAVLDPRGEGTWALDELEIDLGEWFGWVGPRLLPASPQASLRGVLHLRGAGAWRDGALSGRADLTVRDGRFEDPARGLVVEGLALRVAEVDLGRRRTAAGQVLEWREGRYDTIPFGPGRVEFAIDGKAVQVQRVTLAIFGGDFEAGPLEVSAKNPVLDLTARMQGVQLQRMLFLLPPVLKAAQGRLDGNLALRSDGAGLQIGIGRLRLREGETAELQFAPSPGLLTAQLPAAVKQHYPGLEKLETGGIPLRADRLEVDLSPAGDAEGRTATVHIEGGPADPALKAPVVLQINVRGPLESVVKFGTHSKLRFGQGPK
jgi:hypothetical protein